MQYSLSDAINNCLITLWAFINVYKYAVFFWINKNILPDFCSDYSLLNDGLFISAGID